MGTYKVTFLPLNKTVEVDDEKYPLADHGTTPGAVRTQAPRAAPLFLRGRSPALPASQTKP
jgi:hypothetical protein